MSVYNGEKYLQEAIESILNQTFNDFELLIIDDFSTDKTLEILNSVSDKRVRIIRNPHNMGLTKSLNIGIRESKGEFIARMDDDDIANARRIELQIDHFDRKLGTSLLGTEWTIHYVEIDTNKYSNIHCDSSDDLIRRLLYENFICHSSVMYPRRMAIELGGYNEKLRYAQDYELWLRLSQQGEIHFLLENLLTHRRYSENLSNANSEGQIECVIESAGEFLRASSSYSLENVEPMKRFLQLRLLRKDDALEPGDIMTLRTFFEFILKTEYGRSIWLSHLSSLAVRLVKRKSKEGIALHKLLSELGRRKYKLRSRLRFHYYSGKRLLP
jgi:glycosyltransferase involved in cell wall biosynthesis